MGRVVFDPPAAIVTGSLRPPGECEEIPRRRLRPTSRSGALALPTGPLRAQRAPHTIGSGGAAKSPDRESERERARARAALSHRRFAHPASSSEGVQRKGVSTQPLGGFGCLHTGVRRGSGAATARTPWCCRVPKVPRPTYSRVCKQATRVLSEWPSTEVPSGPRRLRPDTTTVLNFVVKAWMEIRARQNATWILIEYLIYNNASSEVNFE